MKQKSLLAKLILASVGLLATDALLGADTDSKVSSEAGLIKTSKTFTDFKVTLEAVEGVDVERLLSAIPKNISSTSTDDLLNKVGDAINSVREIAYPDKAINLEVVSLKKKTKSVIGFVNATLARYAWNAYVPYNGAVYSYNYYDNTAVCFARIKNGTWYGQYQSNGSWYGHKYMYPNSIYTSTATGYDNYKGCHYKGTSSYNLADIIIYIYD